MTTRAPFVDEMVDGAGGIRPHWRALLGAFAGLDDGGMAERARRLERAFADEGITTLLPAENGEGARAWQCDAVPLPIPAGEFAVLEDGLVQRARLMEALLADLYGPQNLLADGTIPPSFVFASNGFLRPCRSPEGGAPKPLLSFYAADLIRGPDGAWRVLADRTNAAAGIGTARENRRMLARVLPEAFKGIQIRQHRPFFDLWLDGLQRLAPGGTPNPAVALLTPGTGHPGWFEHMFLSRELSCALVEPGDLTVRGGALFLKTLRGLSRIDVVLRRMDGRLLDPLEFDGIGAAGIPGLLDAARQDGVRITNDPGTGVVENPGFATILPALSLRLLGEPLRLASVPTLWLGESRAEATVRAEPEKWLLRPAADGATAAIPAAELSAEARADLLARVGARPWAWTASTSLPSSAAPTVIEGRLEPMPVMLRLFCALDGAGAWRALPGGLARVMRPGERLAGRLPTGGISKDVWVLADDGAAIMGPAALPMAALPIRRMSADLPSRVADNLFWLGRYVERLETSARLIRASLVRLSRGPALPRELTEIRVLARCLADAMVIREEIAATPPGSPALAEALARSVRDGGAVAALFAQIVRLTDSVRDRLTGEMYALFTHSLGWARQEAEAARASSDGLAHAMVAVGRFVAGVSGIAAENMVRGGGFLFLDMGRRIERAQAVAGALGNCLDQPPPRIEAGLRLALELCDSQITYRNRYMTVLQPAPVLDLVLADPANPRGLAFQAVALGRHLVDVAGRPDSLSEAAGGLAAEADRLVAQVVAAKDQAEAAADIAPALHALDQQAAELSDRIGRRYFALLPAAQTLGLGPGSLSTAA